MKVEEKKQVNDVWQCGSPCSSQRHLFKTGDRVEVLRKFSDCSGNWLILRPSDGSIVHISEGFFKQRFFILKKGDSK